MCGEDQTDLGGAEQAADVVGARAVGGDPLERVPHRSGTRRGLVAQLTGADPADALVVLGEVGQLEPLGQRANQQLGGVGLELAGQLGESLGGVGIAAPRPRRRASTVRA